MAAPRIYININARNVSITGLQGDNIQCNVSDTEDTYSDTSLSDESSVTIEDSRTTSHESSEEEEDPQLYEPQNEDDGDTCSDEDTISYTTDNTEDGCVDECPFTDSQNAQETSQC